MTREFTGTCRTQWHLVVAWLWTQEKWVPTYDIQRVDTGFGFIGSSGEQRVRELARNAPCIPDELRDKVEKKRGSEIGLDPKYEYFRYVGKPSRSQIMEDNWAAIEFFDSYPVPQGVN